MTPRLNTAPVAHLVLAMYPRSVRDRYGDEIVDLLIGSPQPVRDVADIARCALIEQGSLMSMPHLRSRAPRAAGMLAVPLLLGAALLAVASLGILIVATIDAGASQTLVQTVMALAVIPVSAAAAWLGWRVAREPSMTGWLPAIPVLLAVGILILSSVPIMGEALGEARLPVAVATVLWCLMLTGLTVAASRLATRWSRPVVLAALLAGGVVMLDVTFVVYASVTSIESPLAAYLWFPSAITTFGFGSPGSAVELLEGLKALPALLTTCTAFTLARAYAADSRRPESLEAQPAE